MRFLTLLLLVLSFDATAAAVPRVVHVLVALCDNQFQGIVPVPAALGNGEDPGKNLYWGARYGVKTFLQHQPAWHLAQDITQPPKPEILERLIFTQASTGVVLIADAYRGKAIKTAIEDFLSFSAGQQPAQIAVNGSTVSFQGSADLIVYVGHDGLMDFQVTTPTAAPQGARAAMVLACASKRFFQEHFRKLGVDPLLWSTHLMAPEAYVLAAALEAWGAKEGNQAIRDRAAQAYSKYQKIPLKAARKLLVTGY